MFLRIFFRAIFIQLFAIAVVHSQATDKLKVSVYYEALCSDSITFFTSQLRTAYPIIGDRITLDLIPYGKASHSFYNGRWMFQCHHGSNECYANQIQACALHQDVSEAYKVRFLICLMSSPRRSGFTNPSNIESCAKSSGISSVQIFNCLRGELKNTLLARHGDNTASLGVVLTFVPTIVYNNVFDPQLSSDALYDFLGTTCNQLIHKPANCPKKAKTSSYWWFY